MTTHLSSQEFVNALGGKDGALAPARQSHLDACASCQAQLSELRALIEDAGTAADVPEPSPLFWDHFQARVLTAVQSESRPGPRAWWARVWDAGRWQPAMGMTLVAVSATVVAVVASVTLYLNRPVAPAPRSMADAGAAAESAAVTDASASLEGDEWAFVASVMDTLEGDDIHEVLAPSHDAVDAAIEALTSDQRDRFMQLLKAEMSEGSE
jgi:hypothetical protein